MDDADAVRRLQRGGEILCHPGELAPPEGTLFHDAAHERDAANQRHAQEIDALFAQVDEVVHAHDMRVRQAPADTRLAREARQDALCRRRQQNFHRDLLADGQIGGAEDDAARALAERLVQRVPARERQAGAHQKPRRRSERDVGHRAADDVALPHPREGRRPGDRTQGRIPGRGG